MTTSSGASMAASSFNQRPSSSGTCSVSSSLDPVTVWKADGSDPSPAGCAPSISKRLLVKTAGGY
jgi:hypothetical protein